MRPPNSVLALARYAMRLPEPALRAFAGGTPRSDDGTPLDPSLGALLALADKAGFPRLHELSPVEAREQTIEDGALIAPPPDPMASVEDRFIAGPGGSIRIRIYRADTWDSRPAFVYLHGGGFVVGSLGSHDAVCRRISSIARCIVVAADYRLAPEHRYPAAVEDAEAVYRWVAERAEVLGADPTRIGIGGDSAGGNLATVVCRRLRDDGAAPPAAQILIYPGTDMTMSLASHERYAEGYFLDKPMLDWFVDHYLGDTTRATEPDVSPLFTDDLTRLPPAVVLTAGFDPLRDEGLAYAEALREAGVDVRFRCEEALVHGYINMAGVSAACDAALERVARDVASLL